jgi:MFS transporter, PAT family, beta-lactamase induction signal transducer AmpG
MNKLFIAVIIGLSSGVPFGLLVITFNAFLADNQVALATIGLLNVRIVPYSLKYLWAPFVDHFHLRIFPAQFGQRKSWMVSAQLMLVVAILALSLLANFQAAKHLPSMFFLTLLIAFFAATYDIAMEAFRIELSEQNEAQAKKIILFYALGSKLGMIISGAGGIYLKNFLHWQQIYQILAGLIFCCSLIISFSPEHKRAPKDVNAKAGVKIWFREKFLIPVILLFNNKSFALSLGVVIFYKLSDGFIDPMLMQFLFSLGYSKTDVSLIPNFLGIGAASLGMLFSTYLLNRFSMIYIIIASELAACLSNLLFIFLVNAGLNIALLSAVVVVESFITGICNIVLIQYISSLCSKKFTASHYAILISASSLTKNLLANSSGYVAAEYGWMKFFFFSSTLSIPSIICIWVLYRYRGHFRAS